MSCTDCKHCWFDELVSNESENNYGSNKWVCEGRLNSGIANLKSFPFKKKMNCFEPKETDE